MGCLGTQVGGLESHSGRWRGQVWDHGLEGWEGVEGGGDELIKLRTAEFPLSAEMQVLGWLPPRLAEQSPA